MKISAFSKTYDGVTVLDFPGMELKPGTVYAIIGANGSGKSTFAKILTGVLPADRKGKLIDSVNVGYMPQKTMPSAESLMNLILLPVFTAVTANCLKKTRRTASATPIPPAAAVSGQRVC